MVFKELYRGIKSEESHPIWTRIRWQDSELQVNAIMGWNLGAFTVGLLVFYIREMWNIAREWTMEVCVFQSFCHNIFNPVCSSHSAELTLLSLSTWSLFLVPWWTFGIASIKCGKRVAMCLLRLNRKNFTHFWMVLSECLLLKLAILPVHKPSNPGEVHKRKWGS